MRQQTVCYPFLITIVVINALSCDTIYHAWDKIVSSVEYSIPGIITYILIKVDRPWKLSLIQLKNFIQTKHVSNIGVNFAIRLTNPHAVFMPSSYNNLVM